MRCRNHVRLWFERSDTFAHPTWQQRDRLFAEISRQWTRTAQGSAQEIKKESNRGSLRYRIRLNGAPPWSAAAWRRFVIDHGRSITKRRQAAALQRGAH